MAYLSKNGKERAADVASMSHARMIKIRAEDLDRAFMAILVERPNLANTRLTAL